jgi:hypothetical protein
MSIIEQIRDELVNPLVSALDRLTDAVTNASLAAPTSAPAAPAATAATGKKTSGRPPKIVSPEQLEPEPVAPPADPIDYDKVLTEARRIAAELLQKDQQAKSSNYKDQLVALWKELHPTGNGKLSGLPAEKFPAALERLKQIAA